MLVKGLVLGPSLMVISTPGIQKYIPFITYYKSALLLFTRKQHYNKSLHVRSSDPTCVQSFRPTLLAVFEILGFKLNKINKKKRGPLPLSPMLTLAFIQWCQKWLITESESAN